VCTWGLHAHHLGGALLETCCHLSLSLSLSIYIRILTRWGPMLCDYLNFFKEPLVPIFEIFQIQRPIRSLTFFEKKKFNLKSKNRWKRTIGLGFGFATFKNHGWLYIEPFILFFWKPHLLVLRTATNNRRVCA
jgi:hypothetical protein